MKHLGLILSVAASYYIGAKIGFALTFEPHPVSVLWPPNSILLAVLLLTPTRTWWISLLAALPAHFLVQAQSDVPLRMIWCWFVSNSCEALIGAAFIRQILPGPIQFNRLSTVGIFCLGGAFLGPFLSSFLDSGFVILNRWGTGGYWELWRIRFSSNVLACLTITPFIVTWATEGIASLKRASRVKLLEATGLLLGLIVVSLFLFNKVSSHYDPALVYAPLPFLLWAAVRFGARGATAAIATLSFLAIWGVARGNGPFSAGSAEENALYVQLFLIFMTVPLLFLAALIEERNRVEENLRERDERIGLAAETARLVLWAIDFERQESWMSDKGRELFGFDPEEPLSWEALLSRVHSEDREIVDRAMEQARAGSKAFELEHRVVRPNGETSWLMTRGRFLQNDRGEIRELIGVAVDVTSQVTANHEVRVQREEMARLNRMATMGELTASIAHELNQPLSAIVNNANAGIRFIDRGSIEPDALREILTDVVADGHRANDIIQTVRAGIKKDGAIRRPINLNDLITAVAHMVHGDATARKCVVQMALAKDLPAIEGDPVQLQQVLINLLTNAFDAMHKTPAERRKVQIATELRDDGAIKVTVRDYGVGVPIEMHEQLFEQFFTTKEEGLGMGLAIARTIVQGHGGKIEAENVDEGGARFYFILPAFQPANLT